MTISGQFLRFAIVGVLANLSIYGLYLFATGLGFGHKTTMTVLYFAGVVSTFFANRQWSFRHGGIMHTAFIRYLLAYLTGYLLNLSILWLAVDHMRWPHEAVQLCAIFIVALFLFVTHRNWVFSGNDGRSTA